MFGYFQLLMEDGVHGDPGAGAMEQRQVALNVEIDNATIQHQTVEEAHALDHPLNPLLVLDGSVGI